MVEAAKRLPDLIQAIQRANETLSRENYTVAFTNEEIEAQEPVFLQLTDASGITRRIGITHLVHLKGDWDKSPSEIVARTTDQLVQAILDRVKLFLSAKERGLYIDKNGTLFDFKNIVTLCPDKTFSVFFDGRQVTFGGEPLPLTAIQSEGVIEFIQQENGHTELFDTNDERVGKGMFIDLEGRLYRAQSLGKY